MTVYKNGIGFYQFDLHLLEEQPTLTAVHDGAIGLEVHGMVA